MTMFITLPVTIITTVALAQRKGGGYNTRKRMSILSARLPNNAAGNNVKRSRTFGRVFQE